MNPSAALQSTAEDFLESLSSSPGPSLALLINCVLRSCGCNDSVDEDRVVDYDGVVDALDDFTEALKKVSPPLTSPIPVPTLSVGRYPHLSINIEAAHVQEIPKVAV